MTILYIILVLYAITIGTWIFYGAIMHLRENKEALTGSAKFFGFQVLFIGVILDALFNVIIGTISFAEIPHEALFTARCDRWLKSETWRGKLARYFCSQLLDPLQTGGHCH